MRLYLTFLYILLSLLECTNYSATKSNTAPPTLINIEATAANTYRIEARAQNPEVLFQGYRLYPGLTDKQSRNPDDLNQGIDCLMGSGIPALPNQPFTYVYEITPTPGSPSNGVTCQFLADLGPGVFITVRSLILSLNVSANAGSFSTSGPSNTLVLPSFLPSP
jgi:hypothetical protein